MLLSVLLYAGTALALAGAGAMVPRRMRRKGVVAFVIGLASAAIALFWPAYEQRVTRAASHLDEVMPRWQFDERHEIRIAATPDRIFAAIRDVTPREIHLLKTLSTIRCLGQCKGESILNAPDVEPILTVATRTGFRMVVDDAPRELVFETRIGPQILAVMNFRVEGQGRLTTETRVFAQTDARRREFAGYWRLIRPGSGIIRRSWLEAIKRRAESRP